MQQGPFDLNNIKCYAPVGCCPLDPCLVTEEEFVCAVRTLLPEGPMFNPALSGTAPEPTPVPGVGCFTVGCEPVCAAGLPGADDGCNDDPVAFHMGMVDAYASVAFHVLEAQCCALRELDPCTAEVTVDRWLERYGVPQGECDPTWEDDTKKLVLCMLSKVSNGFILNKLGLESLAAYFGVKTWIYNAGDFNCAGVPGIWTLGRDRARRSTPSACVPSMCPPSEGGYDTLLGKQPGGYYDILSGLTPSGRVNLRGLTSLGEEEIVPVELPLPKANLIFQPCTTPPAIDIVVCQAETWVPDNCLVPGTGATVTPSDELYEAFQWLLERLLSINTNICVYRCEDVPCLENE